MDYAGMDLKEMLRDIADSAKSVADEAEALLDALEAAEDAEDEEDGDAKSSGIELATILTDLDDLMAARDELLSRNT